MIYKDVLVCIVYIPLIMLLAFCQSLINEYDDDGDDRHVPEQSATERFVLRRQKLGTVYRRKCRHQRHCRHFNL